MVAHFRSTKMSHRFGGSFPQQETEPPLWWLIIVLSFGTNWLTVVAKPCVVWLVARVVAFPMALCNPGARVFRAWGPSGIPGPCVFPSIVWRLLSRSHCHVYRRCALHHGLHALHTTLYSTAALLLVRVQIGVIIMCEDFIVGFLVRVRVHLFVPATSGTRRLLR